MKIQWGMSGAPNGPVITNTGSAVSSRSLATRTRKESSFSCNHGDCKTERPSWGPGRYDAQGAAMVNHELPPRHRQLHTSDVRPDRPV